MQTLKIRRQFGLWDSPISPLSLARGLNFTDVTMDQDGNLVWREVRSDRGVLVVQPADGQAPRDFSDELSVRARVGYGGGDFTTGNGQLFFAEASSGRLYRQPLDRGPARPITPGFGYFASPALSPDGDWLLFVHTYEGQDSLGIVDSQGQRWPDKLISGDDFYMQPAWHPNGDRLAWISWNHPNMPWDGAFLQTGTLAFDRKGNPSLDQVHTLAGDDQISIFQPRFSPDGRSLAYVSDESGWWQIYLYDLASGKHRQLTTFPADHGLPAWIQGLHTYGFSPDGKSFFVLRNRHGFSSLWQIDVQSGEELQIALDPAYAWLDQVTVSPSVEEDGSLRIAMLASGPQTPPRVIQVQWSPQAAAAQVLRRGTAEEFSSADYAPVEGITWEGLDGGQVHGLFYPPHNPRFEGLGLPPLLVYIHGGPTSQARASFDPKAQFFASRGYAVLEVNFRGSTGYGRDYWEALRGNWGIYDVQDAVSGARYLAGQGQVDPACNVIMGGSSGGFTVLQALEDFPGFFKAGVCLYGVANQFTLAAETHKFEAHYSDSLLGPLPEAADIYRARSPIFHAEKIQDPLIIFQGEEDQVVPRAQSDAIVAALRQRGVPHEYHLYPGEGHGFRKPETIQHLYTTIEKFLRQYVIYA